MKEIRNYMYRVSKKLALTLLQNKYFILLLVLFFLTRLINLTLLPIFNDESIYLHWGWISTHNKSELYYSLFDGKQPFLMWVFGIMQLWISDPLVAGRLVSVGTGFFTLLGIYSLGKLLFNKPVALIASLLYVLIPIFIFYDRQALMESSISCIGIWLCYFFIKNLRNPDSMYAMTIGLLMGVGLFIKSTTCIFLLVIILLSLRVIYKSNDSSFKAKYLFALLLSLFISQLILLPLYDEEHFSNIIAMNTRFAFSIKELLHFPIESWVKNLQITGSLLFWFITPYLCIPLFIGLYTFYKSKAKIHLYTFYWFILTLIFFIIFTKNPSIRYIVALLPLATIFCSVGIVSLIKRKKLKKIRSVLLFLTISTLIIIDMMLLFSPPIFFNTLRTFTRGTHLIEYVNGFPSGYGVIETKEYISELAQHTHVTIYLRSDSGNPENAMFVYFKNDTRVSVNWLSFVCTNNILSHTIPRPAYLVTRNNQIGNLSGCVKEVKRFYKPDNSNFVGMYEIL